MNSLVLTIGYLVGIQTGHSVYLKLNSREAKFSGNIVSSLYNCIRGSIEYSFFFYLIFHFFTLFSTFFLHFDFCGVYYLHVLWSIRGFIKDHSLRHATVRRPPESTFFFGKPTRARPQRKIGRVACELQPFPPREPVVAAGSGETLQVKVARDAREPPDGCRTVSCHEKHARKPRTSAPAFREGPTREPYHSRFGNRGTSSGATAGCTVHRCLNYDNGNI
jgi:hypothetical protein